MKKQVIEQSTPVADRVVFEEINLNEISNAGIVIPDGMTEGKLEIGRVTSVGPGFKDYEMRCVPGDMILVPKYQSSRFEYDGTIYRIIRETEIHIIFKPESIELEKLEL